MIVTVTANAAVDRTMEVREFGLGALHRVSADRAQAGGKGVNVARVLHALGIPVHAVVVVGGVAGRWVVRDLEEAGIRVTPVWAPGESRTCLEILEPTGRITRLHTLGVRADRATGEALAATLERLLTDTRWLALCGRLAEGLPDETYARCVSRAKALGVRVALDTSSRALTPAWASGPDLLRLNRSEAAEALGIEPTRLEIPPVRAPGSVDLGVISDGPAPIRAWESETGPRWTIRPPRVRARNPIGCGDAMLAGLLAGLDAGIGVAQALRRATALAAAEAEAPVAGHANPERARALEPRVRLEP